MVSFQLNSDDLDLMKSLRGNEQGRDVGRSCLILSARLTNNRHTTIVLWCPLLSACVHADVSMHGLRGTLSIIGIEVCRNACVLSCFFANLLYTIVFFSGLLHGNIWCPEINTKATAMVILQQVTEMSTFFSLCDVCDSVCWFLGSKRKLINEENSQCHTRARITTLLTN